jgi:hypothetical protein
MKKLLPIILAVSALGFTAGCGKSASETTAPLDPNAQPEAQTAVFQRLFDRAKALVEAKDFRQAKATLDALKGQKLTAEQQKAVDALQAKIPKTE